MGGIPILGTNTYLPTDDQNYQRLKKRYGDDHTIQAVIGTEVELSTLKPNESVVYGDGKSYHFLLTKK